MFSYFYTDFHKWAIDLVGFGKGDNNSTQDHWGVLTIVVVTVGVLLLFLKVSSATSILLNFYNIPRCSQDSECIVAYCSCCQRRSGLLNTSIKQAPTIVLVSINMAKTPLSRSQCWNEIGKIKYKALVAIEPEFGVVKTTPVSDTAVNERAYDSHARLAAKTLRYEIIAYKNTDQLNRIFSHHLSL